MWPNEHIASRIRKIALDFERIGAVYASKCGSGRNQRRGDGRTEEG